MKDEGIEDLGWGWGGGGLVTAGLLFDGAYYCNFMITDFNEGAVSAPFAPNLMHV